MAKTKLTQKLWAKIIAFLLLVFLVPIVIGCAAEIIYAVDEGWYAEKNFTFYESSLCRRPAYRQIEDALFYYSYQNDSMEYYDADLQSTNFRFVLKNENGETLYSTYSGEGIKILDEKRFQIEGVEFIADGYLLEQLTVQDDFFWEKVLFDLAYGLRYTAIAAGVIGLLLGITLFIFLTCAAGHKEGAEGITAGWQERIPLDLYLGVDILLCIGIFSFIESFFYWSSPYIFDFTGFLLCSALTATLLLATWVTFVVRIKLGKWWHNTIIYRLLRLVFKAFGRVYGSLKDLFHILPMVWRTALSYCVLAFCNLFVTILLYSQGGGDNLLLFLLFHLILFFAVCSISISLQKLKAAGAGLAAGNMDMKVDTRRMLRDFKEHGEHLNAIGDGMTIAVEQRMKSERLKTELITNVSHDIKTPLTSIINYVDLLQKEHTEEQQSEYLAVLDRQAHKLKKLTEDLVEASKASTGNMTVNLSRSSVTELLDQAVGEYEEKFEEAHLEPVITIPDKNLYVNVDGRLMWRVIDNLLNNACKYSQSGTRLYIDVQREADTAVISFKNISRDRLNVSVDELIERFVRGDSSRTTEGSGLGLNIARSLVELQNGTFRLSIDGDLFKAEVCLPVIP